MDNKGCRRTMEGAWHGDVDVRREHVGEIVEGEGALMRDRAAIVGPDPGKQDLVVWADGRGNETVHPREDPLETTSSRMVGEKGIGQPMRERVTTIEIASLDESIRFKPPQIGSFRSSRHSYHNSIKNLILIVAG